MVTVHPVSLSLPFPAPSCAQHQATWEWSRALLGAEGREGWTDWWTDGQTAPQEQGATLVNFQRPGLRGGFSQTALRDVQPGSSAWVSQIYGGWVTLFGKPP